MTWGGRGTMTQSHSNILRIELHTLLQMKSVPLGKELEFSGLLPIPPPGKMSELWLWGWK